MRNIVCYSVNVVYNGQDELDYGFSENYDGIDSNGNLYLDASCIVKKKE